jgi:hypothetical protein
MKYSISITHPQCSSNVEICNKWYRVHRPCSALTEPAVCVPPKEKIMNPQDQLTLSLLTVCLMKQHEAIGQVDAMLRELIDRMDSVGDLLWRMDGRHNLIASPVDPTAKRKRARQLARKSSTRKHGGKKT